MPKEFTVYDASIFIHANYQIMLKTIKDENINSLDIAKKVAKQIRSIHIEISHRNIVLVLDSSNTFRKDIYPEYKAGRSKKNINSDIINSYLCEQFVCFKYDGLEADDLAFLFSRVHSDSLLVSEDNDYKLMLNGLVRMYKYRSKKFVILDDRELLIEQITKICAGCDSDNIPSIKLRPFGPVFYKKFLDKTGFTELKESLDFLEDMEYISDWKLNYKLAMYDLDTYIEHFGEDELNDLLNQFL